MLQTLDLAGCEPLEGKKKPALCSTHATLNVIFSAIPDEIGKLQNLKDLNLVRTAITSEWIPLSVAPIIQKNDVITAS